MARQATPPDILDALADFEELARLRAERRRAGEVLRHELGASDAELAVAFERIEGHVVEGLSLVASGALAGATRRCVAAWVRLGDERRQPWAAWLDRLTRGDAERRRQVLSDLRKLAAVDSRAFRDLVAQTGRPSPLEYELEQLRRIKSAALDTLSMPTDTQRNEPVSVEADVQSVSSEQKPAEKQGDRSGDSARVSHGGES